MKNEVAIRLFSRKTLTTAAAREQITALSNFDSGLMRPERCGEAEPVRTPFDAADISEPIKWLAQPHGEFLYRKGNPVYVSGVMWNLSHPPTARFPSPRFTNYWTGEFDGKWANKIGMEKIENFIVEMFQVTDSDFALLTTEADLQVKNRMPLVPGQVQSLSYKGLDMEHGIPGLYCINLFAAELAEWLGLRHLPKSLGSMKALQRGAVLLKFGESPADCRSLDVLQRQRLAIEWIGAEKFFDIRFPDRKVEAPNWSSSDSSRHKSNTSVT